MAQVKCVIVRTIDDHTNTGIFVSSSSLDVLKIFWKSSICSKMCLITSTSFVRCLFR